MNVIIFGATGGIGKWAVKHEMCIRDSDYSTLYADVIKWSRNEGYIDYICPQIYFGFKNENQPFKMCIRDRGI